MGVEWMGAFFGRITLIPCPRAAVAQARVDMVVRSVPDTGDVFKLLSRRWRDKACNAEHSCYTINYPLTNNPI